MDGVTQVSELFTLPSLGVAELNLDAVKTAIGSNGNWTLLDSTYTATDGSIRELADVYFDNNGSTGAISSLTTEQLGTLSQQKFTALSAEGPVSAMLTAGGRNLSTEMLNGLTAADMTSLADIGKAGSSLATAVDAVSFIASNDSKSLLDEQLPGGALSGAAVLTGQQLSWKPAGTMIAYGDDHKHSTVGPLPVQVPSTVHKDFLG